MKIGILVADPGLAELRDEFGNYIDMVSNLLSACAEGEALEFHVYDVQNNQRPENLDECDGYICTGSRASVYDDEEWIHNLQKLVVDLHEAKKKFVGICFGHQMVAQALGGKTEMSDAGWGVGVHTSDVVADAYYMVPAAKDISLLVSHKDQVSLLPNGATLLAKSDFCPNAMYQIEDHILTFQGHPEFAKGYSRGLLNIRREIIGEAVYEGGIESLNKETSEKIIARWVLNFIRGKAV